METKIKSIIRNKKDLEHLTKIKRNITLKSASSSSNKKLTASLIGQQTFSANVNFDADEIEDDDENDDERERPKSERRLLRRNSSQLNGATGRFQAQQQQQRIKSATIDSNRRHQCEMFRQVHNSSFKDLDLIKIEPYLEVNSLKSPVEYINQHTPHLNTRYNVHVLKKPFSMKWLKNRRLALFIQSEFYNEFKLAFLLAQCALFNYNSTQSECNIRFLL